jgi:hypothetical protein
MRALPCLQTDRLARGHENSPPNAALAFPIDAPLRSHHELPAAVRLAGQKIAKLSFGRRTDPVLEFLRRTLREARIVAKAAKGSPNRTRNRA